ncbi:ABC transporter ATP-binding protein [Pluralibacter gergoviae]|nr:ABC transporter ATP-binding protein [Pluralibacter gergoviae]ELD4331674.1 ABC transporter ATP-binding protein [Pluralibacter gergoviae]
MSFKDEFAIDVRNITKVFRIYNNPKDRLKEIFLNLPRKIFGLSRVKKHKEFHSLNDVSLKVYRGETIGIIGANGAGKSTLLQIICGTLSPTTGDVVVNGRVAALLELGAGFNPDFTGKENIFISASIMGLTDAQIKERYDSIVEFSEISEFIDQPVKTYSSGMFVRLVFSIIAHVDADILIVDEALSVGDAFFVQKCMRFLREFMEKGTVLFVSHDTASIVNLCDRAIWIDRGQKKLEGSAKEVSEAYLAALFKQKNRMTNSKENEIRVTENISYKDHRQDFINGSNCRNDIELFSFDDKGKQFGEGGAEIYNVLLEDSTGSPLSWIVGGENINLNIYVKCLKDLYSPIIGFYIKDRLGQTLFGDNTFLSYLDKPLSVKKGDLLDCRFEFRMPLLPVGEYSICVAVAEGNQQEHIQHHWIHDAVIFKSHSSSTVTGLVGIPMKNISISID